MSQIHVEGNLVRDPELKTTPTGISVCEFAIAENRTINRDTAPEKVTDFIDCTAWRGLGENLAASLHKGDMVTVSGRLEQQVWEDKDTGQRRSKHVLIALSVGASLRFAHTEMTKVRREPEMVGAPAGDGEVGTEPF